MQKQKKQLKYKPTILVDLDQTCVFMTEVWLEEYYKITGEYLTLNENEPEQYVLKSWDFRKQVKYPEVLDKILMRPGFFYSLEPIKDSVKYINLLIRRGCDVVFLTQVPKKADHAYESKKMWVNRYFPDFDLRNFISTHRKDLVVGDVLIDDNPEHLKRTKCTYKFCIEYSYNKNELVTLKAKEDVAWRAFHNKICELYDL